MGSATRRFAKLFVPYEDGYLYYPSAKSGGKFVSEPEYQIMLSEVERAAGTKGIMVSVLAVLLMISAAVIAEKVWHLGEWVEQVAIWAAVAFVGIRLARAFFLPRRMLSNRPAIVPPLAPGQSRKIARSMLPWTMVIPVFLGSSIVFVANLLIAPVTLGGWMVFLGAGAMSAGYGWVAIQKLKDSQGS